MKKNYVIVRRGVLALLLVLLAALTLPAFGLPADEEPGLSQEPWLEETWWNDPVLFVENVGQFAAGIRFQVLGARHPMWVADDGLWVNIIAQQRPEPWEPDSRAVPSRRLEHGLRGAGVRLSLEGAKRQPAIEPFGRLTTRVSYLIGNDPGSWRTAVPVWRGLRLTNVYPGVDLELTGQSGTLVTRTVVRSGAPLSGLRWRVEGAEGLVEEPTGLRLRAAGTEFILPYLGSSSLGAREKTSTAGETSDSLVSPAWRPEAAGGPLAPDVLVYSTLLGGSNYEEPGEIAVDRWGAAYVLVWTTSNDFPHGPGIYDPSYDSALIKIHPTGRRLEYITFLGGTAHDVARGVAVDRTGQVYVAGSTLSDDFPTTPGAFQPVCGRCGSTDDGYLVKLGRDGSTVLFSTFLGASGDDLIEGLAIDQSGEAYVVGWTTSVDFPTSPGAFDTSYNGWGDVFVAKLSSDGTRLEYGTYLGSEADDWGYGIAVDRGGAAYVIGQAPAGFPTTPGAFDRTGGFAFITKLEPSGSALSYSTFLGRGRQYGIRVDDQGAAYVIGTTNDPNFPITPGAFDSECANCEGSADLYLVKMKPDGSDLIYGTFLGGSSTEDAPALAVDAYGAVYVTGRTDSLDFPTTPEAFQPLAGSITDAFAAKLDPTLGHLLYGTYLGGVDMDWGTGIGLGRGGEVIVLGGTYSPDFPATRKAFDPSINGGGDAFVTSLRIGRRW